MRKEDSKKSPIQPRKAETKHAFTEGGKKPKAEKEHKLETQGRKSDKTSKLSKQAPKPMDEAMHPESGSKYGTNFVDASKARF